MSDYSVLPVITALAALTRAALSPSPLKLVSEDIPNMQSTQAPVMFFDYVSGNNSRNTYGGFERIWFIDCIALMGLAVAVKDTDIAIKSFIGQFYDLMAINRTISGTAWDALVTNDDTTPITMLGSGSGGVSYGAVTFRLQITQMPVAGGSC